LGATPHGGDEEVTDITVLRTHAEILCWNGDGCISTAGEVGLDLPLTASYFFQKIE